MFSVLGENKQVRHAEKRHVVAKNDRIFIGTKIPENACPVGALFFKSPKYRTVRLRTGHSGQVATLLE